MKRRLFLLHLLLHLNPANLFFSANENKVVDIGTSLSDITQKLEIQYIAPRNARGVRSGPPCVVKKISSLQT